MERVTQNPGTCASVDLMGTGRSALQLAGCARFPRITRKIISDARLRMEDLTYRLHLGNELHDTGTAQEIVDAAYLSIGQTGAKLCEGCELFVPKSSSEPKDPTDPSIDTRQDDPSHYPSDPEYTPGPDVLPLGIPRTEAAILLYQSGS